MRESSGNNCVIRRVGLVTEMHADGVIASVGGKSLRLARAKVADGIKPGDAIVWNGKIWTASNGGDAGTSNMRKA